MQKNIQWEIILNSKDISGGFDIILFPPIDPLRFFLSDVSLDRFPEFIEAVILSKSFFTQISYFKAYNEMYSDEKEQLDDLGGIKDGEIVVEHHVIGTAIVPEDIFKLVVYDYGTKLLEVRRNHLDDHRLSKKLGW